MNLFTIGKTKDGRTTVTFSNSPDAITAVRPVLEQLFALSIGALPAPPKTEQLRLSAPVLRLASATTDPTTTTDVRAAKRGRGRRAPRPNAAVLAEKRVERKLAKMNDVERRLFQQRLDITRAVDGLVREYYGEDSKHLSSYIYADLYSDFFKEKGYAPAKEAKFREIGEYQPSKLNTLLIDGKGSEFLAFIDRKRQQFKRG
ncbi:hypothetical protein [Paenibacillus elgii]|uniref:hypothetical protein n=1 Tax=Paenibacillus elgii TaxID=189691 RepID=UPI000248DED1|nr:hypothetical protein [Paenibacillus elgii]